MFVYVNDDHWNTAANGSDIKRGTISTTERVARDSMRFVRRTPITRCEPASKTLYAARPTSVAEERNNNRADRYGYPLPTAARDRYRLVTGPAVPAAVFRSETVWVWPRRPAGEGAGYALAVHNDLTRCPLAGQRPRRARDSRFA